MKKTASAVVLATVLLFPVLAPAAERLPSMKSPRPQQAAPPDEVQLIDGAVHRGTVIYSDHVSVGFKTEKGEKFVFPWDSITTLHQGGKPVTHPAGQAAPKASKPAAPPAQPAPPPAPSAAPAPAAPPVPATSEPRKPVEERVGEFPKPPAETAGVKAEPETRPHEHHRPFEPIDSARMEYEERSLSSPTALVLEIVPGFGVGNFYARNHGWGVIGLASLGMLVAGIVRADDNAAEGWVFISAAIAARVAGVVVAPIAANQYNDRLRKELEVTNRTPPPAKGLALAVEF
ncbi:MAG: hypothetical protein HY897_12980 [Deltaproteobacteria bacterium]|nr:hypothetical protein [Deltaproteobacteria bacterium]